VIVFNNTAVAFNPAAGPGVVRRTLLTDENVEEAGIRFDRLTLGADASFRFEPSARSMVWFQVLEGDAKLKTAYTDGLASAFRTSDWDKPNCRAICDGLTPTLKAARTAFSFPGGSNERQPPRSADCPAAQLTRQASNRVASVQRVPRAKTSVAANVSTLWPSATPLVMPHAATG
jgi:hypothetical protein